MVTTGQMVRSDWATAEQSVRSELECVILFGNGKVQVRPDRGPRGLDRLGCS